jgi:predicted RNA-binding Zn ribbon-like protein
MATKVRKQIYKEKRQERKLKRQAKAQGISVAEAIRRAIDAAQPSVPQGGTDPSAIERFLAAAAAHAAKMQGSKQKPWRWNRDELYEERLARYGKRSS